MRLPTLRPAFAMSVYRDESRSMTDQLQRLVLTFNSGNFKKDGQSRRFVELFLENGVNGVNGVNRGKEAPA